MKFKNVISSERSNHKINCVEFFKKYRVNRNESSVDNFTLKYDDYQL